MISSTWLDWCREYKKSPYTETVELTHNLFLDLKSVKKVAKKREVKEETIERQIIALIVKGLISIDDVVKEKSKQEILSILEDESVIKLSQVKELVSKRISWFEIKAVIASLGVGA